MIVSRVHAFAFTILYVRPLFCSVRGSFTLLFDLTLIYLCECIYENSGPEKGNLRPSVI